MDDTPLRRRLGLDQPGSTMTDKSSVKTGWERVPPEPSDERAPPSVRGVVKELLETAIFILLVFLIVLLVTFSSRLMGQGRRELVTKIDRWGIIGYPLLFAVVFGLAWWG